MKWIALTFLLIIAVSAHAEETDIAGYDFASVSAADFGVGPKTYFVVAATPNRAILELRRFSDDAVVRDVVLWSPHMLPEYEVNDVVSDDTLEVIVRTAYGGTGISETHLGVFGVVADRIVRFGDFIIARRFVYRDREERRSGTVSFPDKNQLVYRYTDSIVEKGKTLSKDVVETFVFDSETMRYKSTREPEQMRAPDRQETAPASR
jgi:hypothetical protein